MKSVQIDILNESWDVLIILDACRYDYFENVWKDYLSEGQLARRLSVGSSTNEWRDNTFPGYYEDIVYITANPQISSSSPVFGYLASDHFKYIYELWRTDWDSTAGTVLPGSVTHKAKSIMSQHSNKKFLIHYIQPHAPYIGATACRTRGFDRGDFNDDGKILLDTEKVCRFSGLKDWVFKVLFSLFKSTTLLSNRPDWMLRKFLGIPPKAPMEAAWRQLGVNGLREAYADNLKAVLSSVSDLIADLQGTIVITSDHGEFLGEDNRFAHPTGVRDPILNDVPWLVIEKDRSEQGRRTVEKTNEESTVSGGQVPSGQDAETDETILQRLRDLGYCE